MRRLSAQSTEPPLPTRAAVLVADPSELPIVSMDYALASRLPPAEWRDAVAFFDGPDRPEASLDESTPPEGVAC